MINRPSLTTLDIDRLAWTIADKGVHTIPTAVLGELGFEARAAGAKPVFTEILLDASAPSVARQRAFGHIATLIARWRTHDAAPEALHLDGAITPQVTHDANYDHDHNYDADRCGQGVAA